MKKITRKAFIKVTGGTGIVVAFSAVGDAASRFIPYVNPPEKTLPGEWVHYATVCRECPAGCGMVMWNTSRRVTKAEGNPEHPVNHGKLCGRGQSSVQGQYDPYRLREVLFHNRGKKSRKSDWAGAFSRIGERISRPDSRVIVFSCLETGILSGIIDSFAFEFGRGTPPVYYEPFSYEALKTANHATFGKYIIPKYNFDRADYIISFGADILETWVSPVSYAYQFSKMRSYRDGSLGRFSYVGPRQSLTAANADTFIKTSPDEMGAVAFRMLRKIIQNNLAKNNINPFLAFINANSETAKNVPETIIDQLVKEFVNSENGIAVAGSQFSNDANSINTAIAANLLNYSMARTGKLIDYSKPHALTKTAPKRELDNSLSQISANDIVIINNTNLVYSYKKAAEFLKKAGLIVYIGTMKDETAEISDWILPSSYYLETWGDYEPEAGIHSLMQPVMAPLYSTLPAANIFLHMSKAAKNTGADKVLHRIDISIENNSCYDIVRAGWNYRYGNTTADFNSFWEQSIRNGGAWDTKSKPVKLTLRSKNIPEASKPQAGYERALWLWPPIMLFDGRLSNRTWMQEVPEPVSYIGWNSWIDINPVMAKNYKISMGDIIRIEKGGAAVEAAANITTDINENVVSIAFGQGHTAMGNVARNRGVNAFDLIGEGSDKLIMYKTGRSVKIPYYAATKEQYGRDHLKHIKLSTLNKMKISEAEKLILPLPEGYDPARDLYPPHEHKNHRWAMVIDLHACIGCGACSVACYAENNIPATGESEAVRGREQAWLKAVPYKYGGADKIGWMPMLCQHCDAAPCEPVCPVFAAVHNEEGINMQVYNRCIGTRYCSNNCPYKVRRFNWFTHVWEKPLNVQLNPHVTVRDRGVMEKCTFCIQRIKYAERHAKVEGRKLKEGEIIPACAQTCPVNAIVFGDLMDSNSEVSRLTRNNPRRYHLLEELNTKPAITYLKKIDNDVRI